MAKRMSKEEKELEARVNKLASRACVGFQINIMDLGMVAAKAKEAITANMDDDSAIPFIQEHVATFATRAA